MTHVNEQYQHLSLNPFYCRDVFESYAMAAVVAFVLIIAGVAIDRLRADMEAGE